MPGLLAGASSCRVRLGIERGNADHLVGQSRVGLAQGSGRVPLLQQKRDAMDRNSGLPEYRYSAENLPVLHDEPLGAAELLDPLHNVAPRFADIHL
jgi:hypothetical protein